MSYKSTIDTMIKDDVFGDDCNDDLGTLNTDGYKQLGVNGKKMLIHRYSYMMYYDTDIPADKEIDHTCKNVACYNPHHLEAVSHTNNVRRGRACKLSIDDVLDIKGLIKRGKTTRYIADKYGVTLDNIRLIKKGEIWKGVE